MNITLNNYEEYFVLLADNELTPAEEALVRQFAAQHPHLQEELEILFSCHLDAADLPVFPKEKLLRPAIWDVENPLPVHTQMLTLLDDELPAAEKEQLKKQIAASPVLNVEWDILQKTVLPAEAITYPDKTELYRQQKIRPLIWVRWAAAAAVMAFAWAIWPAENKNVRLVGALASLPKLSTTVSIPVQINEQRIEDTNLTQQPAITSNNSIATVTTPQQTQKEVTQKKSDNSQALLAASSGKKKTAVAKNQKVIFIKDIITPEQETLALNDQEITTLENKNSLNATLSNPEEVTVQTARFAPKTHLLATEPIQNAVAENTGAVEEDEKYVHIAGARIDKHKMRGLFRGFTRSVARTFSKSKIQPEVVAYNPRKS